MTLRRICCLSLLMLSGFLTSALPAQETAQYFRQNCFSCHTIGGGKLTGPDLKGITSRRDRDWLVDFILDPISVIAGGDAYAEQLVEESNGVIMPAL